MKKKLLFIILFLLNTDALLFNQEIPRVYQFQQGQVMEAGISFAELISYLIDIAEADDFAAKIFVQIDEMLKYLQDEKGETEELLGKVKHQTLVVLNEETVNQQEKERLENDIASLQNTVNSHQFNLQSARNQKDQFERTKRSLENEVQTLSLEIEKTEKKRKDLKIAGWALIWIPPLGASLLAASKDFEYQRNSVQHRLAFVNGELSRVYWKINRETETIQALNRGIHLKKSDAAEKSAAIEILKRNQEMLKQIYLYTVTWSKDLDGWIRFLDHLIPEAMRTQMNIEDFFEYGDEAVINQNLLELEDSLKLEMLRDLLDNTIEQVKTISQQQIKQLTL